MASPNDGDDGAGGSGLPEPFVPDPGATLREIRVKDLLDEARVEREKPGFNEDYTPVFDEQRRPRTSFQEPSSSSPVVILVVLFSVVVLVFVAALALALAIGLT